MGLKQTLGWGKITERQLDWLEVKAWERGEDWDFTGLPQWKADRLITWWMIEDDRGTAPKRPAPAAVAADMEAAVAETERLMLEEDRREALLDLDALGTWGSVKEVWG
jgi:hypothetical protein